MSDILDIARTAVLSYRSALGVTGENIANVDTDGYRRRAVDLGEITGAQTTPFTQASGGQGVQVSDIRRAFDQLLADRLRAASGDVTAAETHVTSAKALEALMLPGTGGIDASLEAFFAGLGKLAASPADPALRRVVMETGAALAAAFGDIGAGMQRLAAQTLQDAGRTAAELTTDLVALGKVQAGFVSSSAAVGAMNPLADQRDALLRNIGDRVGISVEYDRFGRSQVTLGRDPGGPVLLDFDGTPAVATTQSGDMLTLTLTRLGEVRQSRLFSGGTLGGLAQAYGALLTATEELDGLARKLAADANAVHRSAIDLTGSPGGDLFALEGWDSTPYPANRGSMSLRLTPTGGGTDHVVLVRDGSAGLWQAQDSAGTTLATGTDLIVLPGLTIDLEGTAVDGDRIDLTRRQGRALDMRFVPTAPGQIAAALATLTAPVPGNQGAATARLGATLVAPPDVPALASLLDQAPDAVSAVSLIASGVVGYVPAGTRALSLASLGAQAGAEFVLPGGAAPAALNLTLDGQPVSFDLSGAPGAGNLAALAAALNDGALVSSAGQTLASYGLAAAGRDGVLTLARNFGAIDAAALGGVAARLTPASAAGGSLQVFTREGRHVAGTRLPDSEIARLMTQANGFLPGASYRADYLNAANGPAYRGLGLDLVQAGGLQALTLDLHPPLAWSGVQEPPAAQARALRLEGAFGLPVDLALPPGGSARRLADLAAAAVAGLRATAETAVELSAPADGTLSFQIEGDNAAPLAVTAEISGGRLDGLALALNGLTGATGITAELSPDGARLVLRHGGGADIRLTRYAHSAGAALSLRPVTAADLPAGPELALGAGADAVRVTGQVHLAQELGFTLWSGGQALASRADPLQGGLVKHESRAAGAEQSFTFRLDPALDASASQTDGPAALAGATRYGLTLAGRSVTLDTAVTGARDAAAVAAGLAGFLRQDMPLATLAGAALTSLPAEGASTLLQVDGQAYTLQMRDGALRVTGPEAGRVTARFDAANRLEITVVGGVTDAATLALPQAAGNAAAFGLSPAQGPRALLTGQVPTRLPASFAVTLAGNTHAISLAANGSLTLPAGFPATARLMPDGRVQFDSPAALGPLRVLPSTGAAEAGFASLGAGLVVQGDRLTALSAGGEALDLQASVRSGVAQRLALSGLPPEDLIVVMTGSGTLRLEGQMTAGQPPAVPPAVELRVTDASARQVELVDMATGHSIGTRVLDAAGGAVLGGLAVALTGTPATGDAFRLTPNLTGGGDGRALDALLQLRFRDRATGAGGFAEILSGFISDIGTRTAAADRRLTATQAVLDTTERADAAQGGVDLDVEAARLLELQQAYQAGAQVMSVAKQLFDTLLQAL